MGQYYSELSTDTDLMEKGPEDRTCNRRGPEGRFNCTRAMGHPGVHMAGTSDTHSVAEWGDEEEDCYEDWSNEIGSGRGVHMYEVQGESLEHQCISRPDEKYGKPWICTRPKGHSGLCMAGRHDQTMIAQWLHPDRVVNIRKVVWEEDPQLAEMSAKFDAAVAERRLDDRELVDAVKRLREGKVKLKPKPKAPKPAFTDLDEVIPDLGDEEYEPSEKEWESIFLHELLNP